MTAAALMGAALVAALVSPEAAEAALRAAAGGAAEGGGGFARFVRFIDRLANYTIPVGSAFSVLGLIWGGMLFQAGDARAGRVLGSRRARRRRRAAVEADRRVMRPATTRRS